MNPSDPGGGDRTQRGQTNEASAASGSELISYQPTQTPIDFTEFLNIDDDQPLLTLNQTGLCDDEK